MTLLSSAVCWGVAICSCSHPHLPPAPLAEEAEDINLAVESSAVRWGRTIHSRSCQDLVTTLLSECAERVTRALFSGEMSCFG